MAFKTMAEHNKERGYDNYFMLRNDKEAAEVVILYRHPSDVLLADAHYIKTSEYTGYVHCLGPGCPACGRKIPVRTKLFIPIYNIGTDNIEFWDRSTFFENQLNQDVFNRYPNPSEFVFRIIRHGAARSVDTTYEIRAIGKNTDYTYDSILAKFNARVPDVYDKVIREFSSGALELMLSPTTSDYSSGNSYSSNSSYATSTDLPNYQVTPRAPYQAPSALSIDDIDSLEPVGLEMGPEPDFSGTYSNNSDKLIDAVNTSDEQAIIENPDF